MLSYELCKQLKDAGYPQNSRSFECGHDDCDSWHYRVRSVGELDKELVSYPTLSELIEACGDKFGSLQPAYPFSNKSDQVNWYADSIDRQMQADKEGGGSTPEEAVANLYLQLHPKSNE